MNVETKPGPTVTLPDMSTITDTQQGQLPLSPKSLNESKKTEVINDLHSSSLISFGQLWDNKCKLILYKRHFFIMKYEYFILQVKVYLTDGLWYISLPVQNRYIVPQPIKYKYFTVLQPIPDH